MLQLKNLAMWKDKDGLRHPFTIACKDRESVDERWVLTHLSKDEAEQLYVYLKRYFE